MKSRIAIACLVAAGLVAPGASFAWDKNKSATNESTMTQAPNHSASMKEATSDAAITSKVKAAMAKEKGVSATHIKVETDNGVVKLSGTAKSHDEADRAATIAKDTKGVVSVENNIHVATSK